MAHQFPCPNCGEAVAISGRPAHTKAKGQPSPEQATCPTCGELLQRDALTGEGWSLAPAPAD